MLLAEKRKTDPGATEIFDYQYWYLQELVRRSQYDFDSQTRPAVLSLRPGEARHYGHRRVALSRHAFGRSRTCPRGTRRLRPGT